MLPPAKPRVKGTTTVNEPIEVEHFDHLESAILLRLLWFREDHDLDVDDRDQHNLARELASVAEHIVLARGTDQQ
jgi:hypothetical protein